MKLYGVIRVFPKVKNRRIIPNTIQSIFYEWIGTKKECRTFCEKAAKPFLMLAEIKPQIIWDKHGVARAAAKEKEANDE